MYPSGFIITLRESTLTVKEFKQPCWWKAVSLLWDTATQVSNFRREMCDKNINSIANDEKYVSG